MKTNSASGLDAFLSPRWGGVVISNPSVSLCESALIQDSRHVSYKPDISLIMGTFFEQLRLLLGIMKNVRLRFKYFNIHIKLQQFYCYKLYFCIWIIKKKIIEDLSYRTW